MRNKMVVLMMVMGVGLVGCRGEKEEQRLVIENFNLVDTYEYDEVKVIVEREKTPEELAFEVIMDSMGLDSNRQEFYKKVGIDEDNGVFINAGILEGSEIPNVSGFTAEQASQLGNDLGVGEDELVKEYQKLQENRARKVSIYDEDKALEETRIRIEQAAKEQKLRIQEQEKEAQEQIEEKGEPEFKVE